jgi:hypothetical protein
MTKPEGFWFDTGQVLRTWNGGKGEGTSASHLEQELLRNLDRFVGSVGRTINFVDWNDFTQNPKRGYKKAVN